MRAAWEEKKDYSRLASALREELEELIYRSAVRKALADVRRTLAAQQ